MAFGKTFERIAPILMDDLIREFGLTPEQASGFPGNFGPESGLVSGQQEGKPIGTVYPIRGHRGGIDWAQWTGQEPGERRRAFGDFVEANRLPYPSYKASWEYLKHELKTTHKHVIDMVRRTKTAKASAETVAYHFERFKGYQNLNSPNYRNRIAHAERALALYRAKKSVSLPDPTPSPQPIPVNPMPAPTPVPLPDSKPWWQSKTVLTNIATLLASMPLVAKYLGGMDVSTLAEKLSTLAVLAGPIVSSLFRRFSDSMISGSPLAKQISAVQVQRDDATAAAAQPVQEAWHHDEPLTIQRITDHQEVIQEVKKLPWPEFLQLAVKLTPMLLIATESAQKIVDQTPAPSPPPAPKADPLDILRQS